MTNNFRRIASRGVPIALVASVVPWLAPAGAAPASVVSGPAVTMLSPSAGPVGGGTSVTITGTGFLGVTSVAFGAAAATSFTVVNTHTIDTVAPPSPAQAVQVVVTAATGTSGPSPNSAYSYLPVPAVTALSPPTGGQTGGNTVTINGSGFTDATVVSFGSTTTTDFTVWSDTTITAFAPAGTPGTVDVAVGTPGGTSTAGPGDGYHYVAGANPGYRVTGNRVLAPDGSVFMPRGSIVPCLAYVPMNSPASRTNCGKTGDTTNVANIEALASSWHADNVRIQVAQENLFDQTPYDVSYLALVDREVQLANSLGMVATISLQEEVAPNGPVFPVSSSVAFWNFMAQHFENNPMVMFDLFNEPHLSPFALSAGQTLWDIWRNGGLVNDMTSKECTGTAQQCVDTTFVGQQTLLSDIRNDGAANIVIAEGVHDDQKLTGIPAYALSGQNVVYGIEPNIYLTTTRTSWASDYGNLSATYPIFGESLVVFNASALCNAAAPALLPAEFQYMQSLGMGSLVWGMVPGDLTTSTPTLPTTYRGVSSVTCTSPEPGTLPGPPAPTNTIGPGADAQAFFAAEQSGIPLADPSVSWVAPALAGQVTITGDNLTATSDVTFGGSNAPSFTIVSGTEVQATVPASGEGTSVGVLTTSGSTAVTLPGTPAGVSVTAGDGTATVTFGAVQGATSYTAQAADLTTATAPVRTVQGGAGPLTVPGLTNGHDYAITVTAANAVGAGGASSPVDVVPGGALNLTQLSPDAVPTASTTTVRLTGQNFAPGMAVTASGSGVSISAVTVVSPTTAFATLSVGASAMTGPRTVTLTDSSGSVTCVGCLTVDKEPKIGSIAPASISAGAAVKVRVKGQHFQMGATVTIGSGIGAVVTSISSLAITLHVTVPASTQLGKVSLTVTNPDGGKATCTTCISVIAPPTLGSMTVATVHPGQTTAVTLSGTGFAPGLRIAGPTGVTFSSVTVLSPTTVTATITVGQKAPAVVDGRVTVTNSNAAGGGSAWADLLTVT